MGEKHPNRKKDKYNPYTLIISDGRYYLSFKDSRGELQTIEIDEVLYGLFNRFELEDISYLNKLSRHIEHSELTEASFPDSTGYDQNQVEYENAAPCSCVQREAAKAQGTAGRIQAGMRTMLQQKVFGVYLRR